MNDDFERMISDSLSARDASAAPSEVGIEAVYARVGRRRVRRRAVAAAGSVALVAVGVVAVAVVGGDDGLTPAAPAASPDGASGGEWAEYLPAGTPVWQCSGQVVYHDADGNSYWADCTSVTLPEDAGVIPAYDVVPTTISYAGDCLVPATTAPTAPGEPSLTWGEVTPCEFAGCVEAPATTAPLPATVPSDPTATWVRVVSCELPPATTVVLECEPPDGTPATVTRCDYHLPAATATTLPPDDMATTTTSVVCLLNVSSTTTTLPCRTEGGRMISEVDQLYTVVPGDTLMSIADRFAITVEQLIAYNEWPADGHQLLPDDVAKIPPEAIVPPDAP